MKQNLPSEYLTATPLLIPTSFLALTTHLCRVLIVLTLLCVDTCHCFSPSRTSRPSHVCYSTMSTEEREDPVWCPEQQIYIGGKIPDNPELNQLIADNEGYLRLFGYGSLCWNPGTGALAKPGVSTALGRARAYKRCWAQRSADHRGTTLFPGIVCTLLRDDEVEQITKEHLDAPTMTEGLLYTVPPDLVQEVLAELDFREKGGYARDVIDVDEDETGNTVQALLYRGTPDNPAFWTRALVDLPFAAAVMAVSIGPSGPNDAYLFNLQEFMEHATKTFPAAAEAIQDHTGDTDTGDLAVMVREFQKSCALYFLFGSGSNQHNQLLLQTPERTANVVLANGEDALGLTEVVLCTNRENERDTPKALLAGGGHSGLLTESGQLFLWGWNQYGQLGTLGSSDTATVPLPCVSPLRGIRVEHAALGFSHSLVIEKGTGRLYAFGDNSRGQVDGSMALPFLNEPATPQFAQDESFTDVAAGLFHSVAITTAGELMTFGCSRFGQCISNGNETSDVITGTRWRPEDGSRLVRVACGRRHTVVLDEHGRVWTFGENKYGQLGRSIDHRKFNGTPQLVEGALCEKGSGCFDVDCGWSHTVACVRCNDGSSDSVIQAFGWGRNDKGQLGTGSVQQLSAPKPLFGSIEKIQSVACGSEFTMLIDGADAIHGCGWNEHGNLALGNDVDSLHPQQVVGARVVAPPLAKEFKDEGKKLIMAAGGAHFLVMKT